MPTGLLPPSSTQRAWTAYQRINCCRCPSDPAQRPQRRIVNALAAVQLRGQADFPVASFARRQPLKTLVTNVGRLPRDMDDLLRRAIGETIDVAIIVSGGLWHTLVEAHQRENVMLILAIHACDAFQTPASFRGFFFGRTKKEATHRSM